MKNTFLLRMVYPQNQIGSCQPLGQNIKQRVSAAMHERSAETCLLGEPSFFVFFLPIFFLYLFPHLVFTTRQPANALFCFYYQSNSAPGPVIPAPLASSRCRSRCCCCRGNGSGGSGRRDGSGGNDSGGGAGEVMGVRMDGWWS